MLSSLCEYKLSEDTEYLPSLQATVDYIAYCQWLKDRTDIIAKPHPINKRTSLKSQLKQNALMIKESLYYTISRSKSDGSVTLTTTSRQYTTENTIRLVGNGCSPCRKLIEELKDTLNIPLYEANHQNVYLLSQY